MVACWTTALYYLIAAWVSIITNKWWFWQGKRVFCIAGRAYGYTEGKCSIYGSDPLCIWFAASGKVVSICSPAVRLEINILELTTPTLINWTPTLKFHIWNEKSEQQAYFIVYRSIQKIISILQLEQQEIDNYKIFLKVRKETARLIRQPKRKYENDQLIEIEKCFQKNNMWNFYKTFKTKLISYQPQNFYFKIENGQWAPY